MADGAGTLGGDLVLRGCHLSPDCFWQRRQVTTFWLVRNHDPLRDAQDVSQPQFGEPLSLHSSPLVRIGVLTIGDDWVRFRALGYPFLAGLVVTEGLNPKPTKTPIFSTYRSPGSAIRKSEEGAQTEMFVATLLPPFTSQIQTQLLPGQFTLTNINSYGAGRQVLEGQ